MNLGKYRSSYEITFYIAVSIWTQQKRDVCPEIAQESQLALLRIPLIENYEFKQYVKSRQFAEKLFYVPPAHKWVFMLRNNVKIELRMRLWRYSAA